MQATELNLRRVIRAPREKVFSAWTDPKSLQQWWGPGPITCPHAEVDLRIGGLYRLANLEQDGSTTWISGEFKTINPPRELVYTWNVSILPTEPTLVRVEFRTHSEGTELILTHERFAAEAIRDMHIQGWDGCIDKLEVWLAR